MQTFMTFHVLNAWEEKVEVDGSINTVIKVVSCDQFEISLDPSDMMHLSPGAHALGVLLVLFCGLLFRLFFFFVVLTKCCCSRNGATLVGASRANRGLLGLPRAHLFQSDLSVQPLAQISKEGYLISKGGLFSRPTSSRRDSP